MAEGGEDLDPYQYPSCEEESRSFLSVPLITVVDNDMMIKAMAANLTSTEGTPTKEDSGFGKLYFRHSDFKSDHLDLNELPSPSSDMGASSTPLVVGMSVSNPSKFRANSEAICKAVSCPNFESGFYEEGDNSASGADEATPLSETVEIEASLNSEPEPEVDFDESQSDALYVVPKKKMRRYSKKDSLQRKRSKPIIPSPYPSPTHFMDDEGNDEDKNVEEK